MSEIRWEGYTHEEIYRAVHTGPGREVSAAAEAAWAETEALILRIDQRIAEAMSRSATGWEGGAADATRTAMTPLGQWALDAANDAKITATAVTTQGEQARDLRNAMPEPTTGQWNAAIGDALTDPTYLFHGRDDLQAIEQDAANRSARAVDLMNTYTNNSYENRRNMDYWTFPPQVTVETTAPSGAPSGGVGGAGPGDLGVTAPPPAPAAGIGAAGAPPAVPPPAAPPPNAAPGIAPPAAGVPVGGGAGGVPVVPAPGVTGPGGSAGGAVPGGRRPGSQGRSTGTGGAAGPNPATGDPAGSGGGALPPAPGRTGPGPGTAGGVRPVVPAPPPRGAPTPGWRDVIPGPTTSEPATRAPGLAANDQERVPPPARSAITEPPARPGVGRGPAAVEPQAPGAAPRQGAAASHPGLYPPMTAGGYGAQEREHHRPEYLVDDTDAFADDRWFTPAVITPDDTPPPRR